MNKQQVATATACTNEGHLPIAGATDPVAITTYSIAVGTAPDTNHLPR